VNQGVNQTTTSFLSQQIYISLENIQNTFSLEDPSIRYAGECIIQTVSSLVNLPGIHHPHPKRENTQKSKKMGRKEYLEASSTRFLPSQKI